MEVLRRSEFKTMRWPNGQGVAHEIFLETRNGTPLWRLSVAEVIGDCVFSKFIGMTRCTTVVSGAGMDLVGEAETIALRPLRPVEFSGELPLTGALLDGPVENLNIMFDAEQFRAEVTVQTAPMVLGDLDGAEVMAFVLDGHISAGAVRAEKDDCLRGMSGELAGDARFVLIRLMPV